MRGFFIITLLVTMTSASFAQGYPWQGSTKKKHISYLSVSAGPGFRMYYGDIQQPGALFNKVKLAYGLDVRYQWRPRWGFVGQFAGRGYEGKREHGGYADALDQMTGSLWAGQVQVQYNWLKWEDFTKRQFTERDPVTQSNAYVGVGFGMSQFTASFTSRTYQVATATDSLGNDSTYAFPVDNSGSAGGIGMFVPISFGYRYRFNPSWSLGGEIQYQIYINKNLDAVASKSFDGMATLMVRVGYTFGQTKRKGDQKVKRKRIKK